MSVLIDSIEKRLRENLAAGRPVLANTPVAHAHHVEVLKEVMDLESMVVPGAEILRTNDALSLSGTARVFGHDALSVTVGYQASMDSLGCSIRASMPEFPGPDWLAHRLANPTCIVHIGPLVEDAEEAQLMPVASRVGFFASLELGRTSIPLQVTPGVSGRSPWRLTASGMRLPLESLSDITSWLGFPEVIGSIPGELTSMGGLYLSEFDVSFDEEDGAISDASLVLVSDEKWALAGGRVVLHRCVVAIGVRSDDSTGDRRAHAHITARLNLGDQALRVILRLAGGSQEIELAPEQPVQIPSFEDLENLIGSRFSDALPAELRGLTLLELTGLSLSLDAAGASIERMYAGLRFHAPISAASGANLEGADLGLVVTPGAAHPFSAWVNGQLLVNDVRIPVSGRLAGDLTVQGSLEELDAVALFAAAFPDAPDALRNAELTFTNVRIFASTSGQLQFDAALDTDFRSLASALSIPLPASLTTIGLDRVAMEVDTKAKTWSMAFATSLDMRLPAQGEHYLGVSGIEIEMGKSAEAPVTWCRFTLSGGASLSPDVSFSTDGIACSWTSGAEGGWSCEGDIDVRIRSTTHMFGAYIEKENEGVRFGMRYAGDVSVSPWPHTADVVLKALEIGLEKEAGDKGHRWSVTGASHVDIANGFIVADGRVELAGGVLTVSADVANMPRIDLEGIPGNPSVEIKLDPLTMRLGDRAGAAIEAGASLAIKGMPAPADVVFPDGTAAGAFRLDETGFQLTFEPLADPSLRLAFMNVELADISAGDMILKQYKTAASGKKQWRLGAGLRIDGLSKLNELFGGYDLFEDSADLLCSVGDGFTMHLAGPSPLKPVKLRPEKDDGSQWTEWVSLPDTGEFSFRVPEFAFDFAGGRWRASGGVETKEAITLPMGMLKRTLDRSGLPNPFAFLPDRVPLAELDLKNDGLYDAFEQVFGALDDRTAFVLGKISDVLREGLERVPANMDEYLKINIPRSFTFDFAVEPAGGYAFGLRVEGEPLRVLLPWMTATGPALFGITVQHASFGLSAGGSIAVVKCDAWFDQFDLIGLVVALATGQGREFANRFEMRNTTALVPVAAPIPIPLFYERLGWTYRDVLGLNLQAHAAFGAAEEPSVADWFVLLENLFKFFTEKGHYLHQHPIPEAMQLPFTLEPAFFALPAYLGGAVLGSQRQMPTLPVATTLAKALDGIKAGNIGWIIESIPLRYPNKPGGAWIRVGSETVQFGPLEIDAAWCISTSDEFQQVILKDAEAKIMIGDANADDMLTCLPAHYGGASYDKGFVILLKGGLKITCPLSDIFRFTCQFGMASMGPRDFETAIRLRGGFGPEGMLDLGIEGRIKVDAPAEHPDSTRILVAGEIYLLVAQQKFALGGELEVVTGVSFAAKIYVQLSNHLTLSGGLKITADSARIEGAIRLMDATYAAAAEFGKQGVVFEAISIQAGGLAASAALKFPGHNGAAFSLWAGVDLPASFAEDFKKSLVDTANTEVSEAINDAYNQFESYSDQVKTFEASLEGLKTWLPGMCADIVRKIQDNTTDKAVENKMWKWAGKNIGRKIAVRGALTTSNPGKKARDAAKPWVDKLNAVRDAGSRPIDEQYKAGLQNALRNLIKSNEIRVKVSAAGQHFTVYHQKPVLNDRQLDQIKQGIDYIEKLPHASTQRVHFKSVLDKAPREQVLAEVRSGIEKGMDTIPTVRSAGFEASAGFDASALTLTAVVNYNGKDWELEIPVDLRHPERIPAAVTTAFADAH